MRGAATSWRGGFARGSSRETVMNGEKLQQNGECFHRGNTLAGVLRTIMHRAPRQPSVRESSASGGLSRMFLMLGDILLLSYEAEYAQLYGFQCKTKTVPTEHVLNKNDNGLCFLYNEMKYGNFDGKQKFIEISYDGGVALIHLKLKHS